MFNEAIQNVWIQSVLSYPILVEKKKKKILKTKASQGRQKKKPKFRYILEGNKSLVNLIF